MWYLSKYDAWPCKSLFKIKKTKEAIIHKPCALQLATLSQTWSNICNSCNDNDLWSANEVQKKQFWQLRWNKIHKMMYFDMCLINNHHYSIKNDFLLPMLWLLKGFPISCFEVTKIYIADDGSVKWWFTLIVA